MRKNVARVIRIVLTLVITLSTASLAAEEIKIIHNGQPLSLDVPPVSIEGRTMVPLRVIFESLGMQVNWDGGTQTITGRGSSKEIIMQIDSETAFVNGDPVTLDVPPMMISGRTMVPTRFIAESSGASVGWQGSTRTVTITSGGSPQVVPTPPATTDLVEENSLTTVEIGRMKDGVVLIAVLDEQGEIMGTGSGFFVDDQGWIVTNYHVIEGASDLVIFLDDETVYEGSVTILGYDAEKDLALLDTTITPPRVLKLGDSNDVEIGEEVVAIGSPQSLQNTISEGIVSALRWDYIQTTSAISPGSSGGALFNRRGEVIGVTSAGILEGENLGFAIPINQYREMPKNQRLSLAQLSNQSFTLSAPSNIQLTQMTEDSIDIDWDLVPGADYYRVYAREGQDGSYVELIPDDGSIGFSTPPINYYDLTPGEQYSVKLIAVKGDQVSDYSQPVSIRLQGQSLMTDEAYESYLLSNAGVLEVDGYRIMIDSVSVDNRDGWMVFMFSPTTTNVDDMEALLENEQEAIERFLVDYADEAAQYYHNDFYVSLVLTHLFYEYPEAFTENSLFENPVEYYDDLDGWYMYYPIVRIEVPELGDYYYPEWEESFQ